MVDKNDVDRLRFLLPDWIKLSNEHAEAFRIWSEKTALGKQDIMSAALHFDVAARALEAALEKLASPIESNTM